MKKNIGIVILVMILACLGLFLIFQIVPYGRNHTNPAVIQEPSWATPQAREIAKRACFDCHSNETVWPWYSNIAPISWLIQRDVDEGRQKLNFSEWNREQEADEIAEVLQKGEMPLPIYLLMHPTARLSAVEKQALIDGLGVSGEGEGEDD